MKLAAPVAVAFREVRHFQPDDCLHCEALEVRGAIHEWTIPAHRHEALHQLMWLARGRAQITFDHVPHQVTAPALLLVVPGCVHSLDFEQGSAGWQVTVPSGMLRRAFADAPALAARLADSRAIDHLLLADAAPHAAALFDSLAAEFEGSAPGRIEALQAHVVLIVTRLLRLAAPEAPAAARQALRDTLVQRYRALMALHLRRHEPLRFYADALKITPDHLSRACREVTGQSALDLLHQRVMLEARQLLAYTDATVHEVASELGFDDPAYFSRFFARHEGRPPQAYRAARLRGEAATPPRSEQSPGS